MEFDVIDAAKKVQTNATVRKTGKEIYIDIGINCDYFQIIYYNCFY